MLAMVLSAPGTPLQMRERADPIPGDREIRVKVSACGGCRTDLHVVDGELPGIRYPAIPGHEIVGRVDLVGRHVTIHRSGDRVGIPWLGYISDGGFATHARTSLASATGNAVVRVRIPATNLRTGQMLGAAVLQPWGSPQT